MINNHPQQEIYSKQFKNCLGIQQYFTHKNIHFLESRFMKKIDYLFKIIDQFSHNTIQEWNTWFTESPEIVITNLCTPIILSNTTYIQFCCFIGIMSTVTLTSQTSISLCIEDCSFIDCYRDDDYSGGAIFFGSGSNCVLSRICAYQCFNYADSKIKWGQFCCISVEWEPYCKIIFNLVSIIKCSPVENEYRYGSFYLKYGLISLDKVNSSYNRCYAYSGVRLENSTSSSTSQSTFNNNTDSNYVCIRFRSISHIMSECNIIRNHQNSTSYGTILNDASAQTSLFSCVIDMNTPKSGYVIYVITGSVTLMSCFIQDTQDVFGNVNISSRITNSESIVLYHFQSHHCDVLNTIYPTTQYPINQAFALNIISVFIEIFLYSLYITFLQY